MGGVGSGGGWGGIKLPVQHRLCFFSGVLPGMATL